MQVNTLAALFLCFAHLISANILRTSLRLTSGASQYTGCEDVAETYTYDFVALNKSSYPYYDVVCGYPPAVGTLLLCLDEALNGNAKMTKKVYIHQIIRRCHAYSAFQYDLEWYQDQLANATANYIAQDDVNTSLPVYLPVYPNMADVKAAVKDGLNSNYDWDIGTWFAVSFYGYFLIIMIISFFYNVFRLTGISKFINNTVLSKAFKKWIIFPTLIPGGKFVQEYGNKYFTMLFPNRIQFIVDLLFFVLEVGEYTSVYKSDALSMYLGYRSGIMAFGKIPLLILFSGRNNLMLWVTGWSYSTFLHYHKVVSFWMFVDCVIHSVAYTVDYRGYYVSALHEVYFASGIAATVICGVLILQSVHIVRNFFYEYFLTMHIVFAICFIATCWWHCNVLGWMEWMVASIAIWSFDRFIRIVRMCAFGYKTATITVVDDQLMKLEVPKPSWWLHTSGSYGYVYFAGFIFWENHPLTLVVENGNLCAYIRVKRGVTARVWRKLLANNNKMSWRVCIEGPYGGMLSLMAKRYEETIFVAGGSGAPGILEGAITESNGKFIWVSQTLGFVTAYQSLIEQINIPIEIYITRENAEDRKCSKKELLSDSESDSQSTKGSEKNISEKELGISSAQISIYYQRPNLEEIINHEVSHATSKNVAIVACGPPVLMDSLRNTITNNITKWEKGVDFFDEFQIW